MNYQRYKINAKDLTDAQIKIIAGFDLACGERAKKRNFTAVNVGFNKGSCFHVSFIN